LFNFFPQRNSEDYSIYIGQTAIWNPGYERGDVQPETNISIVMPVLNEQQQIGQALESLGRVSPASGLEIVVVDGGSSDRTLEYARHYKGVKVVEFGCANRGGQMNAGAEASDGEVLLFLHADVGLPDNAIFLIREAIRDDDQLAGGCFLIEFPESSGLSLKLVAWGINLRTRLFQTATGDQAIFVRREVFDYMKGYREIPLMEDVDFFNRLKRSGRVAILGACVKISPRRWRKRGIWRTVLLMYAIRFGYLIGISPRTLKRFFIDVR